MTFERASKKINNACNYVIQKLSMLIFRKIESINIYFKIGKLKIIRKKLKNDVEYIFLRKLPSHHGEVSAMLYFANQ